MSIMTIRLKVIVSVEAETSIASCLVVMPLFRLKVIASVEVETTGTKIPTSNAPPQGHCFRGG